MISMIKRQGSIGKAYGIGRVHLKELKRQQQQGTIVFYQFRYLQNVFVLEQNFEVRNHR